MHHMKSILDENLEGEKSTSVTKCTLFRFELKDALVSTLPKFEMNFPLFWFIS